MKLNSIRIENFKSISEVTIDIKKIGGNFTYCLFGINESGKSSVLRGIALYDEINISYPEDFFDESKSAKVVFDYTLEASDVQRFKDHLIKEFKCPKEIASKAEPIKVEITSEFSADSEKTKSIIEKVTFKSEHLKGYYLNDKSIVKIEKDSDESDLNLPELVNEQFEKFFYNYSHTVVFWESSDQYLMLDEISLTDFATNPKETSVPLYNCFRLAGMNEKQIEERIKNLNSAARIRNLESKLSRLVTEHIRTVWEDHPVSILFEIDSDKISLLIEDEDVHEKAKTTAQRSDGFKQFISFLLTISADDKTQSLNKKILLIDEPETHLHPQAQINLKNELNNITNNSIDTMVIYATHSNYLIDKGQLDRNFKVVKKNNETTEITQITKTRSTYSEVNFEVFDIATTDYHNELYGFLEDVYPNKLNELESDRDWINERSGNTERVSLPKYIRHSIHHPENTSNRKYSEIQLRKSINILRKLKYE